MTPERRNAAIALLSRVLSVVCLAIFAVQGFGEASIRDAAGWLGLGLALYVTSTIFWP